MKRGFYLVVLCLVVLGLSGCGTMERLLKDSSAESIKDLIGAGNVAPASNLVGETRSVIVYFADATGKNLVPEERLVPKTLSLARETINELLKGPGTGSDLLAVVAQGTTLLDINIKGETAIVDFSKEIQSSAGKVTSDIALNAIVNTLTQFPTIKQVKFRVEGQSVQKIGSTSTVQALTRNTTTVKTHPITQKPAGTTSFGLGPNGT